MYQINTVFSFDLREIVTETHTCTEQTRSQCCQFYLFRHSFFVRYDSVKKNCECSSWHVFQIHFSTDSGVHNRGLHSHINADIYEIRPIQGSTPICILRRIMIKVLYRGQLLKKNNPRYSTKG